MPAGRAHKEAKKTAFKKPKMAGIKKTKGGWHEEKKSWKQENR
jgi:hypothetical protein